MVPKHRIHVPDMRIIDTIAYQSRIYLIPEEFLLTNEVAHKGHLNNYVYPCVKEANGW